MLLLDHSDFLIQPTSQIGFVEGALIHIIVHRLLLRRSNNSNVKLCYGRGFFEISGLAHVVKRMAVMRDGRSCGSNLGVSVYKPVCVNAVLHIQQIRISVQMVEVLEQRKIKRGFYVHIRLALSKYSGKLNCKLLVADSGFKHRFILRLEAGNSFLLLLFVLSYKLELSAQVVILAVTEELMREPNRLVLRSVHKDYARFCKRVGVVFGIALGINAFPVIKKLI